MKENSKPYFILKLLLLVGALVILIRIIKDPAEVEQPTHALKEKTAQNSNEKGNSSHTLKQGDLLHRLGQNHKSNLIKSVKEKEESENQRREAWKENFPYKPILHSKLKFDPNRYDPNNPETFNKDDKMRMAVRNHGFMKSFFNNPQIYSAEFEQLYNLLKEVDRAENPKITALIFTQLLDYHKIKAKHDLNSLWSKEELVPSEDGSGSLVEIMVPIDGKTSWGDKAYEHIASIVGLLVGPKHWPEKLLMNAEDARAFRDRLVKEIPSENFVTMPYVTYLSNGQIGAFGYDGYIEKSLKSGDQLLMVTQSY